jgi:serine protease inhibitor
MRRAVKNTLLSLICIISAFTLCSCEDRGKSTQLRAASDSYSLTTQQIKSSTFADAKANADDFASKFAYTAYSAYGSNDNIAVSPISVYMALALSTQCAANNTQQELLSALNCDSQQIANYASLLYNDINVEYTTSLNDLGTKKLTEGCTLKNSVWLDKNNNFNNDCLDNLANNFYCNSFSADFSFDNENANKAVSAYVRDATNKLIDKNFELNKKTIFALINTLYLKDLWNVNDGLNKTKETYNFANQDNTTTKVNLLNGGYKEGRVQQLDNAKTFFTTTLHDYKLKFIVPDSGYTIADVFTQENIQRVNSITDYGSIDEEANTMYWTRCLFPEFEANYDNDIRDILTANFGISEFFDKEKSDLRGIIEEPNGSRPEAYCSKIQHVTKFKVDKNGIEGAAVTVVAANGAESAGPSYKMVYETLTVDKAFGFILTDKNDVTLFSGVINKI